MNVSRLLALVSGLVVAACSGSSSTGDPNVTPGQCVLRNAVWYCGAGYGSFPACPGANGAQPGAPCDQDAGSCFECGIDGVAGIGCSCKPGDGGVRVWECLPSGTGCGL